MTFHRIVIQLPHSLHNEKAIVNLFEKIPSIMGPVHGPHECIKRETVHVTELMMTPRSAGVEKSESLNSDKP